MNIEKPLSIREAAGILGISERHLHSLIKSEKVRAIRLGRRIMVPAVELRRLCDQGTESLPAEELKLQPEVAVRNPSCVSE